MGMGVIALAIVGIAFGAKELATRREVASWLVLLVAAIALSTGPAWLSRLPLTLFRYPARLVPFAALAMAGLAVIGWQRLRGNRRWLDLLIVLVIAADLLNRAQPLLGTAPFRRDVVPYDASIGDDREVSAFRPARSPERAAVDLGLSESLRPAFRCLHRCAAASAPYMRMYRGCLRSRRFDHSRTPAWRTS
jgi:hypothetical protein